MIIATVLFPMLIATLLIVLFKNETIVKLSAAIGSIASLLLSIYIAIFDRNILEQYKWFNLISYSFGISFATYLLNIILLLLVAIMTPIIVIYSIGYFKGKSYGIRRFYIEMLIFASAMMLFAISENLITIFIAWEILGITSYMLIGFWYDREEAQEAARRSITTIVIGDILFLSAIIIIFATFGTTEISGLINTTNKSLLYLPMILIMIAAFTKSAQFPFNEWLADAMEAPTPVSAFLHSSTMVKAGVFLIALLLPIYESLGLNYIFVIVGVITAIIAVTNALSEHHIKRILAYSTMEDLALMFIALGLFNIFAAMLLFIVQTFYKALLFMNSGVMMNANNDNSDIYKIHGLKDNRIIRITTIIGVISLAGIIPFGSFFAKSMISTSSNNIILYIMLLAIELLSSTYIFRWMFIPLKNKGASKLRYNKYKNTSNLMKAPIIITTILALLAPITLLFLGGVFNTYNMFGNLFAYVIDSIVIAIGILIAYVFFMSNTKIKISKNNILYKAAYNSTLINKFYSILYDELLFISRYF
jgi:NADH-quinone oxidoreductase subunit L